MRIILSMVGTSMLAVMLLQGCAQTRTGTSAARKPAGEPLATTAQPGPCTASELKLRFDGRNGDFTGMSHDGALLVLRNTGSRSCTVPKRPQLTFTDATGKAVALTVHVPPGMHPGPVMVPVTLAPGAAAQGKMQWVMGDVYDGHNCVAPAHASLTVEGGVLTQDLRTNVCAPAGQTATYEQEFLQPAGTSGAASHTP